jgi:hypothetical protein
MDGILSYTRTRSVQKVLTTYIMGILNMNSRITKLKRAYKNSLAPHNGRTKFMLFRKLLIAGLVLLVTGCGGGGSSSGGGGGAGAGAGNPHAGFYSGIQTTTATFTGGSTDTSTITFSFNVAANGQVSLGTSNTVTGPGVRANAIQFTVERDRRPDLPCTITENYVGTINNGFSRGTIDGVFVCDGLPDIPITGSFETSR